MQDSLSFSPAPRRAAPRLSRKRDLLLHAIDRVARDRDCWVSVVCGAGFALLMWVDWLAA